MNTVIENILETARTFTSNCGAFVVLFKDGHKLSCKTPEECQAGIGALYYMKAHPEVDWEIDTIKLPEEGGTHYWMKGLYGNNS